jgi:hypothetical protein
MQNQGLDFDAFFSCCDTVELLGRVAKRKELEGR